MIIWVLFVLLIVSCSEVSAEVFKIGNFAFEGLAGWEHKNFKGQTEYTLATENGTAVVKAHSKASASGLLKKVNLSAQRFRYLQWSWKIAGPVVYGDEKRKDGDDYAARVYVVFPGRFFWQTKAVNYIWANHLPIGRSMPNVFTGSAMMIAVESGPAKAGQWLKERRDILSDYRQLFGDDPPDIGAIAIMTDTDNTGSEATAWYGDIVLISD